MFPESAVRITGAPSRHSKASDAGNTVTRLFCGHCGSPLFGMNTGMPGFMTLMMGTLDASDDMSPQVAIFTRSRRAWDPDDPNVQSFDTQPGWVPSDGAL
jgi:hypothetical protein